MSAPLWNPELSNVEQTIDPIATTNQSSFEDEIARAEKDVKAKRSFRGLSQEEHLSLVENLARARMKANLQDAAAQTNRPSDYIPNNEFAPANARISGSVVDTVGAAVGINAATRSGVRNAENIGDLLPVAGALAGPVLLKRTLPPAAAQFAKGAIGRVMQMAAGTERAANFTGSALGAAAGGIMEDQLDQASAAVKAGLEPQMLSGMPTVGFLLTGPVDSNGKPLPMQDTFSRMANAAMRESLVESVGLGVGDVLTRSARASFGLLVGDTKLATRALEEAEKVGVPVGLVDVVDSKSAPLPGSLRRVFAAMGPMGTPFRDASFRVEKAVRNASIRIIAKISPEIGVLADMAARGEDVNRLTRVLAERSLGKFNLVTARYVKERDRIFGGFYEAVKDVPATPATTMAEAAQLSSRFHLMNGSTARFMKKDAGEKLAKAAADPEMELLAQDLYEKVDVDSALPTLKRISDLASRIEPNPSIAALMDFSKQVESELAATDSKYVAAQLMQMRRAVDADVKLALKDNPELLAQLEEGNKLVESYLTLAGGAAGRRVRSMAKDFGSQKIQMVTTEGGRVVKNAGARDHTQVLSVLSGADSVGEVSQLYGLLAQAGEDGKRTFRRVAATRIQRAVSEALAQTRFSVKKAFGTLGLFDPASSRGMVTREFLRRSGVDVDQISTLAKVAQRSIPEGLNLDTSAMVARRAVLGGVASGVAGSLGYAGARSSGNDQGASITAGVATAVASLLLARRVGEVLTNPNYTRWLIQLADKESSPILRTAAYQNLSAAGLLSFLQNDYAESVTGQNGGLSVATPLPLERGEPVQVPPIQ